MPDETPRKTRGPDRPYPSLSVTDAAKLADALREHNAGRPMNRILLADAVGLSPSGSPFRDLVSASAKYGFTKGHYNSETIELTARGDMLSGGHAARRLDALREGFRAIPVFEKALQFYNNGRLPSADLLAKAVQQPDIGVGEAWANEFVTVFTGGARDSGFVRDVGGRPFVLLEAGPPPDDDGQRRLPDGASADEDTAGAGIDSFTAESAKKTSEEGQSAFHHGAPPAKPLQFFVAHGRSTVPLEQLKRILTQFKIPFVVAQDEPNVGRPISAKVKDLMDECTAGIFIFSADEQFSDKDGQAIWRPRENVVYELGAASYLYGRRIVVFKEDLVQLPSDFNDLGWISFTRDNLEAKAVELMQELIALGALRLVAGEQ